MGELSYLLNDNATPNHYGIARNHAMSANICSTTQTAKKPATVEKAVGLFVDSRFRSIPDADFIDQALFSSIERFQGNGKVSVSYLSRMVSQTREHTSRRLAKWVRCGYLLRIELAEDRSDYRLTKKAKEAAATYHKERLELYPDQKPKAVKQEPKPQETPVVTAFSDPVIINHTPCDNKSHNKEIYKTLGEGGTRQAYASGSGQPCFF